jgi:hypothetical protein
LAAFAFIGICGLVALASGATGGMLGFLFGIPRTLVGDKPTNNGAAHTADARFTRSNTNLEQVSDWLTKIVIGATLVEAKSIGGGLAGLGAYVEDTARQLPGLNELTGLGGVVTIIIVLFFFAGFLTLYLQTRTFLSIMFARTEHVMADPELARAEMDILEEAACQISLQGPSAVIPPAARVIAERALGVRPGEVSDPAVLRQRGFAQVVLGQLGEGASTLKRAYVLTKDEELGRIVSRLLARAARPGEAKDLLGHVVLPAADAPLSDAEADALLTRMFVSLYEPAPLGFNEAQRIGDSLDRQPAIAGSPKRLARLELYRAAALGQCYGYTSAAHGGAEELARMRAAALAAAQKALAADPSVRPLLKDMLDGVGQDDDLKGFNGDPEFKAAILGT